MPEKTYASHTLGLESTSEGIKSATLSLKGGRPTIDALEIFAPDFSGTSGSGALDLSGKTLIVSSIGADEVLVRPLEVKLKKQSDIDAVLPFQAEPLLPYPIENALLDKVILSTDAEGSRLTLIAVKKEHLQRKLEFWKEKGIESEIVSAVPVALNAFSTFVLPPSESSANFVLHLGEDYTCCIYVKEGHLVASKFSPVSLQSIKQTFKEECGITDENARSPAFDNLNPNDSGSFPATFQKIKESGIEIGKVIFSLMKQTKELNLPPLLATGEGAANESLCALLLKEFDGQIIKMNPPQTNFSEPLLTVFAIPVGEALTALPNYADQINFLQGDFAFPRPWKRLTRPLTIYFLLSLALAASFYLFGQAYIADKENRLRQEYLNLLSTMQKSPKAFEEELASKIPVDEAENQASTTIESLSPNAIDLRVGVLEKELQAIPNLFPLEPNIPKVSDFLAWLSTHPNIVGNDGKSRLITLVGLNYAIIKRPDLKNRGDKYQVKIELDFTSANATAAREFHDALLAPNNFIDPKTEIKWTTQKGRYKAIFLLKDRTHYP